MNNFLGGVKQTLSGQSQQAQAYPLGETEKAIADIENKKNAITQASNNEQNVIMQKIQEEYRTIGESAYNMYIDDNLELKKITDMLESVKELHRSIEEKKKKLNGILERYEEELDILRPAVSESVASESVASESVASAPVASVPVASVPVASVPIASQSVCQSCGAAYVPGEMLFCRKCGGSLSAESALKGDNISSSDQKSMCPKCNAPLIPGSVFCSGCGSQV